MRGVSAPSPEENARQCFASSSAAKHSSSAWRVGLPDRPYSKPLCLPTPCWANVVAMWIGCTTAPVAGPGPWPTCKARVAKPQLSLSFAKSALAAVGDELEQVGARDHGDRRLAPDHYPPLLPPPQRPPPAPPPPRHPPPAH